MQLKIKKINKDAVLPSRAHEFDAGLDLFSVEDLDLLPGERKQIKTGIIMAIPEGYVGLIWDKSGLSFKYGLKVFGGVIDSGYRGEIMVVIANTSQNKYEIKKSQKIAQLLIQKVELVDVVESELLSDTQRGIGGFGSSGLC